MKNIARSHLEMLQETEVWFEDTLNRLTGIVQSEEGQEPKHIILNTGKEKILLDNPDEIRIAQNTIKAVINTLQFTFPYSTKNTITEEGVSE
ncbi:hypothetical protein MW722_001481 [Acinetobacter baumannii]|uniref:Uncharacterized protein n=2 Tax=Acinetobacter baumannii TaxID=470 RepID=A0AAN5WCL9_ACIBA|nr:hypothetical protein [Acinetobacter baumannii]ETY66837.1 hypothetical protein X964_17990 [Acinetobacter baumannii MDR_MMC4]EXB15631.1 hypothetical protein J513_0442 [Acinetobacter baumannii 1397084]EXD24072.1 hypothetical protein J480_2042 [Acinetobacter baumannii 34654]EYD11781.1 hypothetical protein J935_1600 [Acinetobacter baumannii 44362_2]EYU47128.1 hypothetical protein J616_03973 [Acinetobacter baumannii 1457504]KCW29316.1 hypothetical protein J474_3083 [Acinetobacter baumannii 6935]